MLKLIYSLFIASLISTSSFAYSLSVTEIATPPLHEPCVIDCGNKPVASGPIATPTPTPPAVDTPDDGVDGDVTTTGEVPPPNTGGIDLSNLFTGNTGVVLGHLTTIGTKVWDFMITNKPNATYNTLNASVVPEGLTSWTQLTGWSRPVQKTYRVEFKDLRGKVAGGFDYRITFISGGNLRGKGKFIGQIAVAPSNIKLKTDRSVNFHAEILEPLNFGTEEDPVAGVQLLITFNSPTTLRYTMHSVEYFMYGTGEMQKISGTTQR